MSIDASWFGNRHPGGQSVRDRVVNHEHTGGGLEVPSVVGAPSTHVTRSHVVAGAPHSRGTSSVLRWSLAIHRSPRTDPPLLPVCLLE